MQSEHYTDLFAVQFMFIIEFEPAPARRRKQAKVSAAATALKALAHKQTMYMCVNTSLQRSIF